MATVRDVGPRDDAAPDRNSEFGEEGTVAIRAARGIVAGVAAGLVFGLLMQSTNMIPAVAALVGSTSAVQGWAVHLTVSVVLGGWLGVVTYRLHNTAALVLAGVGYALGWWALGALLIMPYVLGVPVLRLDAMAWSSLAGHLAYGIVSALVLAAIGHRAATPRLPPDPVGAGRVPERPPNESRPPAGGANLFRAAGGSQAPDGPQASDLRRTRPKEQRSHAER